MTTMNFQRGGSCAFEVSVLSGFAPRVRMKDLDTGMSLTNAIEEVATRIYLDHLRLRGVTPMEVEWVATDSYGETCRVTFGAHDHHGYSSPSWVFLGE